MSSASNCRRTLLHVPISHYSEKARWALDLQADPARSAVPPGGLHPLASLVLTRGQHHTVPVLVLDGEAIGDSTAIIRCLEDAYPEPPLHPSDPTERKRALVLEDQFDEELGPTSVG